MPVMSAVYLAAAVVLAVLAIVLLWIAASHLHFARYHRGLVGNRPIALRPLGLAGTLRYYRRLLFAALLISWWTVRAAGRDRLRRPAGEATGPPVLCVHGFFRNGSCMWGIRQALEGRGRPTLAVSMGRPFRPIERYAPPLESALRELVASFPGQRIDVAAHSMGGVVLRLVLARRPELAAAVGRIVTLGSPHRGTAVVRGLALAPEHRQLEPGSAFLRSLPDFRSSAPGAEVTTVAAERDLIVYPRSTSHLPGARAIDLAHANHQSLLTGADSQRLVADLLQES